MVEHHLAKVGVAGSNPVSRSKEGGVAKWLRRRSAKPLFIGSIPIAASFLSIQCPVDAHLREACRGGEIGRRKGLKIPRSYYDRAGSSPALGTFFLRGLSCFLTSFY